MVNIELYRIFIAIYRAGTISKAAVLCDITQPAASQQLASLEKTLKVKLFERTPRKMVPTNDGHELYTRVADSFDWLDYSSQDFMMQREEKESLLHIGVPLSYYQKILSDKIYDLPFRLDVHFGDYKLLQNKLVNGKIDLMISDTLFTSPNFYSEIITSQNFCLVGSKNILPPEQGFENWQYVRGWVQNQKWISYDAELSLIRSCFKVQYDLQPNIDPKFIIPDLYTMLKTLSRGSFVGVLPEYFCKEYVKNRDIILLHPFHTHSNNKLYLTYENSAKSNILIKKFSEYIAVNI